MTLFWSSERASPPLHLENSQIDLHLQAFAASSGHMTKIYDIAENQHLLPFFGKNHPVANNLFT